MEINVGVSNHHVHLCEEDFKKLFGDIEMNVYKNLSQKGQFASDLFVTIKTDKSLIEKVRVLGPYRSQNQIEISKTDAYKLGINPPVRDSGDLSDSSEVVLIGPKGSIKTKGCIIAVRHIHANLDDIKKYNLEGIDVVSVKLKGEKGGIIDNVHIKVHESFTFELHIDTDDANAHLVKNGDVATILF